MLTADIVSHQLDELYRDVRNDKNRTATIQNWSLSTWLAAVAAVSAPPLHFSSTARVIIPLLPVAMFWFLSAMEYTFIAIHQERARALERALATGDVAQLTPEEVFFCLGDRATPYGARLRHLLRVLFTRESVLAFYLLQIAATVVLSLVAGGARVT